MIAANFQGRGFDPHFPSGGQGASGVQGEVQEKLLDLGAVGTKVAQRRA